MQVGVSLVNSFGVSAAIYGCLILFTLCAFTETRPAEARSAFSIVRANPAGGIRILLQVSLDPSSGATVADAAPVFGCCCAGCLCALFTA